MRLYLSQYLSEESRIENPAVKAAMKTLWAVLGRVFVTLCNSGKVPVLIGVIRLKDDGNQASITQGVAKHNSIINITYTNTLTVPDQNSKKTYVLDGELK